MNGAHSDNSKSPELATLPGDDVRQLMWRYADRYDLQMLVQSARSVARGLVARLVADGARHSHEWTQEKAQLLSAFDEAGLTGLFMDPEYGGFIEGPKNMAMALAAFELSWVDGGATTCSLAGHLALSPIHERGTKEQVRDYMTRSMPPPPGEDRRPARGAFCLTEPLPYIGVDTSVVSGKMRVAEWEEGKEPVLQVDKRGRFITNMDFADYVVAAVESDDERIKGSCMIILEEGDPGLFDRGAPTLKLVHQLSSTRDPVFSLKVPAGRIVGGYTVKDGVIIPAHNHSEVIRAVFRRTRVTVGLMTAAKLLSAVEPVIRYQRGRFRGGEAAAPGTQRYELGLQQREDAVHRLVDVWATGEASASLGFAAARFFDEFDPIEKQKEEILVERGIQGGRAQFRALQRLEPAAVECLKTSAEAEDPLVAFLVRDVLANVICPATKLWNTGHGANMMREAVSLMGGYGITEDCPGFLPLKWMDAQLEATYEGPEAVQRRQLSITMNNKVFLAQVEMWISEMGTIAADKGARCLATAMELWLWTLNHLFQAKDANGKDLYRSDRQGVSFPLADALCWILASRYQILDVLELEAKGPENPALAEALPGFLRFFTDLCHIQAARAAGEVGRICAELVYGYVEKAEAVEPFPRLRSKVDEGLASSRLAKDRAARMLTKVMIPEALDYPS